MVYSYLIAIYIWSYQILHRIFQRLYTLIMICFSGFWLGILNKESLYLVDEWYYNTTEKYSTKAYNKQGLFDWEEAVIAQYFPRCKKLLVIGAGGGREVLSLYKMGYETDGFECNDRLVKYANAFLAQEDVPSKIRYYFRDSHPAMKEIYDGVIIGWGSYMLIQGKEKRITFLYNIRRHVEEQSPLLLSFFCRSACDRRFKIVAKIANTMRWLLRREALEIGDYLSPNYVHYFIKEEIASEMQAAGFKLTLYSTKTYGHAVGIAGQVD